MHYDTIKEQTKNQIIDLYNDLFDTDTLIQVIATKTAHMDGMPKPPGSSKKDLSDIVLRHEKQLKKWYREISYEIDLLLQKKKCSGVYGCVTGFYRKMNIRSSQRCTSISRCANRRNWNPGNQKQHSFGR